MPYILYPNVPNVPGVPKLLRPVESAIASNPVVSIAVGTLASVLGASLQQQQTQWGIFDQSGKQLGATQASGFVTTLAAQLSGEAIANVSTVEFAYTKEARLSDFATEGGKFATYNKVMRPANPTIVLGVTGSQKDRSNFIAALDAAQGSTDMYNIVTPEVTYVNYNIERYSYARRSSRGQTLLLFEISLQEARGVSVSYTAATQINNPQLPSSTAPVDSGKVQSSTPDTSTLKSIFNKLGVH